ncbi:protein LBH-like [Lissotriton helveticus]
MLRAVMTELIKGHEIGPESLERRSSASTIPFQIFPDPCDSYEGQIKVRDRLPSIVVEPTDMCEVESGELRWPPEDFLVLDEEHLEKQGELASNQDEIDKAEEPPDAEKEDATEAGPMSKKM